MSFGGFLGSFLSKDLKTTQLEVNTDEKTLRPIARLKEPRDLFALPKDKDHDCSQQAPRWPIECQVIEERIVHIPYVPLTPEPYNEPSGLELKPRPVGEENGVVVYNYNPISAVNYDSPKKGKGNHESSDSDISSSESRGSSPECNVPDNGKLPIQNTITHLLGTLQPCSSSNSNEEDDEDVKMKLRDLEMLTQKAEEKRLKGGADESDIEDIWLQKSPDYEPASPMYIKSQFGRQAPKTNLEPTIQAKTISPVRFDAAQLARLDLDVLSRCSSSSSISTDYTDNADTDEEGGQTVRKQIRSESIIEPQINSAQTQTEPITVKSQSTGQDFQDTSQNNSQALTPELSNILNSNASQPNETDSLTTKDNKDPPSDSVFMPQFSRSSVGGSRFLTNCHPYNPDEYDGLEFESRFESGNLAKAVKITKTYYELYLRPDLYTSRSKQWFYFRVRKTRKNIIYRFSIVNLVKSDSLYNDGMRPLMYSTINAKDLQEGWRRCGQNVCYYRNDEENGIEDDDENSSYTLTFNIEFPHDDDTVYFAHSYPYTYSDLQDYLMEIQKHPAKSKFCKLRLLCRSLAGNNVYYLTVTAPTPDEDLMKRKKTIVVSARVHPSETPASWMMKGLMDFITGDTIVAKRLRHKFIFKLIPMLNPDGVIVGNTRNSLTGKDLNRQYRTVIRETYPSIWYTKAMIKRLIDECGVAMYCDMHAHSRKHNIFIYGCENKRNAEKKLAEQVFPLMMHKNVADKFSFESCKFKVQRSKEGTGRIVVWMLGITNSYTIEASFGGSSLGSRKGTHFHTADYEQMGRVFCETLWDYSDENPNKVKKNEKLFKQIKKIRKREKREKKALKIKKLAEQERLRLKIIERLLKEGSCADEPLNIPLSDYSSDEGETGSDCEGKNYSYFSDLEGPCCAPLRVPPCSPEAVNAAMRKKHKFKVMRKIMNELDRIYFQPLLQKRFRNFMKPRKTKKKKKIKGTPEQAKEEEKNIEDERMEGGQEIKNEPESRPETPRTPKSELTAPSRTSLLVNESTDQTDEEQNILKNYIRRSKKKQKKSKTSDVLVDKPDGNRRIRISRNMRLWLAARKIIILRRKKSRKSKLRKSHRRKEDAQRTPLDMPTTDPGSDLLFSTDDDTCVDLNNPTGVNPSIARARSYLLQSDLQRRYIEEIGDGSNILNIMPPELIVTSPTKLNTLTLTYRPATPRTAPADKNLIGEFPLIGEPARRTSSWHNLHNGTRCVPKLRAQSPFQGNNLFDGQSKEELEFRLSLKKKIWSGIKPENSTTNNYMERNRPLSWGMPTLTTQTKKDKSPANAATTQTQRKDENEVLFTACSQKLLAWQQQEVTFTPTKRKSKLTLNLVMPDIINEEKTYRIFKQVSNAQTVQHTAVTRLEPNIGKPKKRKNPTSKISDTSQLLTRLSKSKTSLLSTQRQLKAVAASNCALKQHKQNVNKFKTSGIVATAVQPIAATKKNKGQLRAVSTNTAAAATTTPSTAKANARPSQPKPTSTTLVPISAAGAYGSTISLDIRAAMEANTFVRKVKTKMKKKKSNAANSTLALTSACALGPGPYTGASGGGSRSGMAKKSNLL